MIYIKSWSGFYLLFLAFPFSIIYLVILFIYSTPMNLFRLFTSDAFFSFLVPCVLTSFWKLFPYSSFMISRESLEGVFLICSFLGRWAWLPWAHSFLFSSLLHRGSHQVKPSLLSTMVMLCPGIPVGRENPVALEILPALEGKLDLSVALGGVSSTTLQKISHFGCHFALSSAPKLLP